MSAAAPPPVSKSPLARISATCAATCIGMRFAQREVKAVLTRLLQRFHPELKPGRTMTVRQMPTLSPRGGMPMVLRERVGTEKTVVGSLESST